MRRKSSLIYLGSPVVSSNLGVHIHSSQAWIIFISQASQRICGQNKHFTWSGWDVEANKSLISFHYLCILNFLTTTTRDCNIIDGTKGFGKLVSEVLKQANQWCGFLPWLFFPPPQMVTWAEGRESVSSCNFWLIDQ